MSINESPLVSMGIPAYNHDEYVVEAILSVIAQSYQNIELIIINDGSTDSTHECIQSLESSCRKRFVNFVYINRSNRGISYSLNEMLNLANGKYFMGMASDDLQAVNRIETFVKFMESNISFDCCYSGYKRIDKIGALINEVKPDEHELQFREIILGLYKESFISYIIKVEVLKSMGGYIDGVKMEDWDLALRLTYNNIRAFFIEDMLYYHRIHGKNTHLQQDNMIEERFKILEGYKDSKLYNLAYFKWKVRYSLFDEEVQKEFAAFFKSRKFFLQLKYKKCLIYGTSPCATVISTIIGENCVGIINKKTRKIDFTYDCIIVSMIGKEKESITHLVNTFKISPKIVILIE